MTEDKFSGILINNNSPVIFKHYLFQLFEIRDSRTYKAHFQRIGNLLTNIYLSSN